ncbi:alpha/beta hydrolase [Pollutimonas subterranea]|uniref:Alpha/beta hydrolase n=1 Tax=Pollutimonas subterranea TaxID=2045210 RepID=A0A2N4U3L2_9BURK|nr:alpha/beta hydrolase [Pollutimonas subterranea]PLC49601.1 alpha/beta hydrolase [Pollutimonas subterranea]
MKKVEVFGATVSYRVDGNGPGLVLVSGTGGNLQSNWDHLIDQLTPQRSVVRVDYSGSGETLDTHESLSVQILAEQVVAAAKASGAVPFDLVGYSLGAGVAIYIAAEYPELVRSLVLLAGFASGQETRLKLQSELWLDLIRLEPRAFARLILLAGFSPPFLSGLDDRQVDEWIDAICTVNRWDGIARQIDLDRRLDISAQVQKINRPTLVIGCGHDQMVPVEHSRALAATITGSRYAELDSGHLAPFECPDEFVKLVLDFIDA